VRQQQGIPPLLVTLCWRQWRPLLPIAPRLLPMLLLLRHWHFLPQLQALMLRPPLLIRAPLIHLLSLSLLLLLQCLHRWTLRSKLSQTPQFLALLLSRLQPWQLLLPFLRLPLSLVLGLSLPMSLLLLLLSFLLGPLLLLPLLCLFLSLPLLLRFLVPPSLLLVHFLPLPPHIRPTPLLLLMLQIILPRLFREFLQLLLSFLSLALALLLLLPASRISFIALRPFPLWLRLLNALLLMLEEHPCLLLLLFLLLLLPKVLLLTLLVVLLCPSFPMLRPFSKRLPGLLLHNTHHLPPLPLVQSVPLALL
jgi:hypothetical protein